MSSRTKVSKQVKVTQGKDTTTFELTKQGLRVEHTDGRSGVIRYFTLKEPAMDALRELLGMQQPHPSVEEALSRRKDEKALTLPPEEFDERFRAEEQPAPREPEGTPTPEGLKRDADGVETGMD